MKAITSKANVCLSDGQCHQIMPGLTQVFSESRNYSLLTEAWRKWRDATGRKMKDLYKDMVNISNEAFMQLGYEDTGDYWRSWYESPTLQENLEQLLMQLEPLYKNLHAYIRRKLRNFYGEEHFPASGHVPAHLFGNMWGQQWNNIYDLVEPFKGKSSMDVTSRLQKIGLKPLNLFKVAEEFFTSLGLLEMPQSFWEDSMIVKPEDRDVMCHASAWDFHNGKDFRIKMCTKVDMEDLMTIHHEMGHIQYFLQYKDLPISFRNGANNGFHEAVGDVMELSVSTPEHLRKIGFLDNVVHDSDSDINFLMSMALKKIAFLPFGYMIDQWRWSVFSGETTPEEYNEKWWQLRCKLQGMSPPIARTSDDFDAGAKYHVASNTAYIRYFISFVIQFQFHKALCTAAGKTGPLHRCDIYQSREAGKLLGDMLAMGSSQPWQEAMEKITGQREMNAEPLMEYFKPLTDWLREQNQNDTIGWTDECPQDEPELINDAELAKEFLLNYDNEVQEMDAFYMSAYWNYVTNITDYNQQKQVEANLIASDFSRNAALNGSLFNWKTLPDPLMRKQFASLVDKGTSLKDKEKTKERSNVMAKLKSIYAKAKACLTKDRCLKMEPDLNVLMATSRDQEELLQGWKSWRNATGPKMKNHYARFVELSNEGAKENGYNDVGEYWRSWYDTPSLRDDLVILLDRLQVLYLQLHTYVKGKLVTYYGKEHFPRSGHIPAHLLGNMWAQNWNNIYDIVQPFKDKKTPNITKTMLEKNITVNQMFKLSEDFFVSLNLSAMPLSFWENSILERPTDRRDMVCHASAWDFGNAKDFRIKMCSNVSLETFQVIHHEMGHIEYYLQYKDQPWQFRAGANPGFHEAVGDVMAMSVVTPAHLHKLGLLETVEEDFESDINFLMSMALGKIAFLPFGYLIDQWRWSVFSGETTSDEYNKKWWQLRCKYQGVSPSLPRSEEDFDPGSKYHVPGNTPYIRYFISHVVQFQFHKALCDAAGHTGPLHKCDIYQSKEAGKLLGDMLKLGSSKSWQEAMEAITGQRSMSVEPIIAYFQPLIDWLTKQNLDKPTGWLDKCQQPRSSLINDKELARTWLDNCNKQAGSKLQLVSKLEWENANNHESSYDNKDLEEVRTDLAEFNRQVWLNASRFDWEGFTDMDLKREFGYIREQVGINALADPNKLERLKALIRDFKDIKTTDVLKKSLATNRNYSQLITIWLSGQRAGSDNGKDKYAEIVELSNEAANELGFMDTSEVWRSQYESETFQQDLKGLWEQVKPLYQELHTYVRQKLRAYYGAERFPVSGQIPAHILGTLMGGNWQNLNDLLMPYRDIADVDITPNLNARNYTTEIMFHKAEEFFTSIGLSKLPVSFWEKSIFMRQSEGQNANCNPLYLNLGSDDVRVRMCTDVDQEHFVAVHEELARIQYSRAYTKQPLNLQGAANPGFAEAVAGLIGLSVSSSEHLHHIGLLEAAANKTEDMLNFLMRIGLKKIPSLPFGYVINHWQHSVFSEETKPETYDEKWWKLRCKYQGFSPPEHEIDAGFFYPGTEDHGSINMPYIRYFVGTVLEFQLHEGLCKSAGHTGPLHTCDIYQSRKAGALLMQMLESGRSQHWQDILETLTDQRHIDAASLVKYFQPLYDWLKEQNMDQSTGWVDDCSALTIGEKASDWLSAYILEATDVYRNKILSKWNYSVNITADTAAKMITSVLNTAEFAKLSAEEISKLHWKELADHDTKRQLKTITQIGQGAMNDKAKLKRLYNVQSRMKSMYKKGKVCLTPDRCIALEPGMTEIMSSSRNKTVLLNAWKGWRATTRSIKPYYTEFVDLSNEGIRDLGYEDTGEYWRSKYESPNFVSNLEDLWTQLTPLYENIHAYVRKRLGKVYGMDTFPTTGHIPAHLLGSMWGQSWGHIYDLVIPYKGSESVEVTPELKRQGYTVTRMFKTAEDFYVSLGLSPLPMSFWNKSMLEKPVGRDVECKPSAWDMLNQSDVRIKMCATVNMENLLTIHHEIGHIQYFLQYRNQPITFRRGANPGFPEAIGDAVTLSVSTPSHLRKIGLVNTSSQQDDIKADINFLMMMALEKIAFLPFGYLVDQWRWSVFEGETTPEQYNEKWWQLRCRYQGVSAPLERTEEDFDPGAIYDIPANKDFVRHFVSSVMQFQFHKVLCDAAGQTGPLHKCGIYQSKEAGKLLSDTLKLGSSVPWPEAMKKLTGQSKMDVGPLLKYFQPLSDWLQTENLRERPGWSHACPTRRGITPERKSSATSGTSHKNTPVTFLLFVIVLCKRFVA
ncbi:angiotensin-converting enzyme-like [Mizuhopecten yessoensis]|uniref:angiotensin-converting enzyme-like n=1 Tax=Mizuhopecten yessoensis TaxID=6573 RepID=UPI000B45B56B|nr:angiotensin-converting enzyme-like [Mizuhopecten yessoensis]